MNYATLLTSPALPFIFFYLFLVFYLLILERREWRGREAGINLLLPGTHSLTRSCVCPAQGERTPNLGVLGGRSNQLGTRQGPLLSPESTSKGVPIASPRGDYGSLLHLVSLPGPTWPCAFPLLTAQIFPKCTPCRVPSPGRHLRGTCLRPAVSDPRLPPPTISLPHAPQRPCG